MNSKSYFKISGIIFLVVAAVHLLRALQGWDLVIHTFEVPVLASWAGVLAAGYLSYQGLSKK